MSEPVPMFYYDPFVEFNRLLDDALAERTADQQLARRTPRSSRALEPRMDVHEDAARNVVEATFELPGLRKEDVRLDVQRGRLTVAGEAAADAARDAHGYAVRERRYGRFARTLQLPAGVEAEQVKAAMENGVLTVTFPRASDAAAPKRISVV